MCDGAGGHVLIFYRDADGQLLRARVRHGSRRWWGTPDIAGEKSYLYGLDRLTEAQERIIIVEGESDCQVLWHCGFAAVGAPGQSIFKPEWARCLRPCERVYILREPRATLPDTVAKAVAKADLGDPSELLEFTITAGEGDALALWRKVGCDSCAFRERLEAAAVDR